MSEYAGIETVPEEDEAVAGLVQKGEDYPVTEHDEPVARLTELVPPQVPDDEDE
jgi:antitoxin (DNA-binding transcriptional repressor) of toxin-antitoxin stability system